MPYLFTAEKHGISTAWLQHFVKQNPTPCWLYDAQLIRQQIAKLRQFDIIRFAQKACSNTHILQLMREQGVNIDAVSLGEIRRALHAGFTNQGDQQQIVFTADLLDEATIACVVEHNIPVNAGSIDMLSQLGQVQPGHRVWLRINPGFGHGHSKKTNTGGENSKHGIWYSDLPLALAMIKRYQLQLVGLHMHIGSGVDYRHLAKVCQAMVAVIKQYAIDVPAISAGGGLTVGYQPDDPQVDIDQYYQLWHQARLQIEDYLQHPVKLELEPGRYLVAASGLLISQVRAMKTMGNNHFVLVDAGFNDLMRPTLYGSYHHISPLYLRPAPDQSATQAVIVAGPLCESGDVFTQLADGRVISRDLPLLQVGDYLIFHDVGAYGAVMSSGYNSRPLLAEWLFDNGQCRLIRRPQTIEDLLALEM